MEVIEKTGDNQEQGRRSNSGAVARGSDNRRNATTGALRTKENDMSVVAAISTEALQQISEDLKRYAHKMRSDITALLAMNTYIGLTIGKDVPLQEVTNAKVIFRSKAGQMAGITEKIEAIAQQLDLTVGKRDKDERAA